MKQPVFDTTPETSLRMSHVPHEGGKAESVLAKALWHRGYRYRLNYRKIIGSPDIAMTKYKIAIFVDGELWHGYDWENRKTKLVRNKEYWLQKIERNMERDKKVNAELVSMGWIPLRFWAKEVLKDTDKCIAIIESTIQAAESSGTILFDSSI